VSNYLQALFKRFQLIIKDVLSPQILTFNPHLLQKRIEIYTSFL